MDSVGIAAAFAGATQAQTSQQIQTSLLKSQHQADLAMADMIMQLADMAAQTAAAPPPGMGANVDVTA